MNLIYAKTYGHSGLSSSAYYYFGIAQTFAKFANGTAVVDAGFLAGMSGTNPFSNLPGRRAVNVYGQATAPTRFGTLVFITAFSIPAFTKRPLLVAANPTWSPYV